MGYLLSRTSIVSCALVALSLSWSFAQAPPSVNSGADAAPAKADASSVQPADVPSPIIETPKSEAADPETTHVSGPSAPAPESDEELDARIDRAVAERIDALPVKASHTSKGFRFETRDGNWQTNLQWRAQFRLTYPTGGDPRQVDDFEGEERLTFQARRLRMKIGGHGYRPWLKYYFEVDLQPTRSVGDSGANASARVIDWRIDIAKWDAFGLRVGQWKIDYNRERVDSSGRQQFVERSIVNRIFTIDRQVGVSLRGHLFKGSPGDLRYYIGAFTGEGRGVSNDDTNLLYAARLQWNFLGRDLALKQTDVERTEKPTASLAFGGAMNKGRCTRWSSSGCGNLDGFAKAGEAELAQFETQQAVQELAFKWQGFSLQQELHFKRVIDDSVESGVGRENDFFGLYAQAGYFFSEAIDGFPEPLELAFRYAAVREPNETDRGIENDRQAYTGAANWFFDGHNNKLTLDYSYLTLADEVLDRDVSDHRVRFQWDISF